ncbi:MAG TPA: type I methionyl aminopeptidase [Candidatus Rifleibacterium sp.]|nr:type I methionyl aminopeptidase [Candidatus Rifleibacterium sp.]
MTVTNQHELTGITRISEIVAIVLREMKAHARTGMTTAQLDAFGGRLLQSFNARSAPKHAYGFPGFTCISLNHEIAHGIPSEKRVIKDGDLINIDVSAELNGFWADNGTSFVIGRDLQGLQALVDCSRSIMMSAINSIRPGMRVSELGRHIEKMAQHSGFRVIKNLAGHGVGRALHEEPHYILNCEDKKNTARFKKNSVVAIETFISTKSTQAEQLDDGWTLVGNHGGHVAQHEHTILISEDRPLILTAANSLC